MNIAETMARHERIVLQFSGGKDSLAVLYLLREWWPRIAVVWCNTGDAFPETHEVMERVKRLPINFHEVRPYLPQQESVRLHGYPSDIVPSKNVRGRDYLTGVPTPNGVLVQDFLNCCGRLRFRPLKEFSEQYEATLIIRGQRRDERMHSPVWSGFVDNEGVEYLMPIEDWTERQVYDFLDEIGVGVPAYYARTGKGLDCMTCTAFNDDGGSASVLEYTRDEHPEAWRVVVKRLEEIQELVEAENSHLKAAISLVRSPQR